MQGCLLGTAGGCALWALAGLFVLGLLELGLVVTVELTLATVGAAGLITGALLAARRLSARTGRRRLASRPGHRAADPDHALTRAFRRTPRS
jgi:hypothetical protein